MTIQAITTLSHFRSLRFEWNELLQICGAESPFLHHEWFECCIDTYGSDAELSILLFRDSSKLLAIAPLWRRKQAVRHLNVSQLEFILCPETNHVDLIVDPRRRDEILLALAEHLARSEPSHLICLCAWPADSPNLQALQKILEQQHIRFIARPHSAAPYIEIHGNWDDFLKSRSQKFRKTHRNICNRIGRLQGSRVSCIRRSIEGEVLLQILALSKKAWKDYEGIGIASQARTRAFFSKLTEAASSNESMMVWFLHVNDCPIAMEYHLTDGKRVYALRSDFDAAYKEYSPGAYLEFCIIKHLFDSKYLEYNSGPGINSYKLHWTETTRKQINLTIPTATWKGRLFFLLESKMIPLLKNFLRANS